jgi:hypothetical protein
MGFAEPTYLVAAFTPELSPAEGGEKGMARADG